MAICLSTSDAVTVPAISISRRFTAEGNITTVAARIQNPQRVRLWRSPGSADATTDCPVLKMPRVSRPQATRRSLRRGEDFVEAVEAEVNAAWRSIPHVLNHPAGYIPRYRCAVTIADRCRNPEPMASSDTSPS